MGRAVACAGFLAGIGVLVALSASPSKAAPFSDSFDGLRAQLEYRRDIDFSVVPLTATQKKQQKAVLKSLALLDRPADDLGDDCKTLQSVVKLLVKAYPEETTVPSLVVLGIHVPFLEVLNEARGRLATNLGEPLADLQAVIGRLAPSPVREKALAVHQAAYAEATTSTAGQDLLADAKRLPRSWKLVGKGMKLANKGKQLPAPSMTWTVDETGYTAGFISWRLETSVGTLFVTGEVTDEETGTTHHVLFEATGVLGPGTFTLNHNPGSLGYFYAHDGPSPDTQFWSTDELGGTLSISALDMEEPSVSGTFSFTATGGPGSTTVTVSGSFTATWNHDIYSDEW